MLHAPSARSPRQVLESICIETDDASARHAALLLIAPHCSQVTILARQRIGSGFSRPWVCFGDAKQPLSIEAQLGYLLSVISPCSLVGCRS